jgi:hypothetical protein
MTKAGQSALCASLVLLGLAWAPDAARAAGPFQFHSLTPCRIVDTRNPNGPKGGPVLQSNVRRDFPIQGECGVPDGASAVSLNVTAVFPTNLGWITIWPSGQALPGASTVNFAANDVAVANGAIVALSTQALDLSVLPHVSGSGVVHLVLDVTGYFD